MVVGPPDATAAPVAQRQVIPAGGAQVQLRGEHTMNEAVTVRTITYLPIGLASALFAPFPWSVQRAADLAVLPEMLVWYVVLAAVIGVLRERPRWSHLAPVVLFALGGFAILALAEGNVGTLYRHRAMFIPWIFVLAAPALARSGAVVMERLRDVPLVPRQHLALER